MKDIAGVFRHYAEIADKGGGEIINSSISNSVNKVVQNTSWRL